jgi:acyl-CoA reductase-like NAD-dependent aldehyde dehydrogenase
LRSTRAASSLDLAGAWRRAQDASVHLGRWGCVDVQLLVEEHERGRVLVRAARRLRATPFVAGIILAATGLTLGLDASGSPLWLAVTPLLAALAAGAAALWRAARALALVDTAIAAVLFEAGAAPLGAHAAGVAAGLQAPRHDAAPVVLGAMEQHAE